MAGLSAMGPEVCDAGSDGADTHKDKERPINLAHDCPPAKEATSGVLVTFGIG